MSVGELKTQVSVNCTVCGCKHIRRLKITVQSIKAIEASKEQLRIRASKKYTCRICKTIINSA